MIELTCYRAWYECDNLHSEPAPERYQGRFDDPEEAIRFMAEMCAKSNQWECYVYNVSIVEEAEE